MVIRDCVYEWVIWTIHFVRKCWFTHELNKCLSLWVIVSFTQLNCSKTLNSLCLPWRVNECETCVMLKHFNCEFNSKSIVKYVIPLLDLALMLQNTMSWSKSYVWLKLEYKKSKLGLQGFIMHSHLNKVETKPSLCSLICSLSARHPSASRKPHPCWLSRVEIPPVIIRVGF